MDYASYSMDLARRAKQASRSLASASGAAVDRWLARCAQALTHETPRIVEENSRDVAGAETAGLNAAMIDRLRLTPSRIAAAAEGMRAVAHLANPLGKVLDSSVRPNGLVVHKVSVPLGVIFFIYESRPNVTLDAAALCVKSGNAVILRGGKEALHSNLLLHEILQKELSHAGLPADAVQLVNDPERSIVTHLLGRSEYIDLAIPRGGEALIRKVAEEARMPVLKHYMGNCHVYVDASADFDMAERIILNSKCQRPGVCNAAESLLVHADIAEVFLPRIGRVLAENSVEIRGCPLSCVLLPQARHASEADFAAEFLDLILSVKVVQNLEEAIGHIARYGSAHTDAIVSRDLAAARKFTALVDSSAVMVNASTRFNDGFELGLGAEIGISTDKFHARGPCGLQELCSYKWIVQGNGQVRE